MKLTGKAAIEKFRGKRDTPLGSGALNSGINCSENPKRAS